jgi:hypothetical protein
MNLKENHERPSPHPYKIHLKGAEDVRRLLSATINELRRNEIDPGRAGKIIYASSVLLTVFQQSTLEVRLKAIEEAIEQGSDRR